MLKELIRQLHAGLSPEEAKERFKGVLSDVSPLEIAKIEQELVEEGMPREEIQRLCDVHLSVLKESLDNAEVLAPAGHPVHILMEEHKLLLGFADDLKSTARDIGESDDFGSVSEEMGHLGEIAELLKDSEGHYVREENVLFPYLEKHGVTEPPAIMWTEHNKIREIEKGLDQLLKTQRILNFQSFAERLVEASNALGEMLSTHFYKENNILFPAAMRVVEASEWNDIRRQFDELGYCRFTPEAARAAAGVVGVRSAERVVEGMISFESGTLSSEELELCLNALPVDLTFVGRDDTVRYFSQSKDRIFPRTRAVIGRKVQQCHPQKSIHVVNKILEDFRAGRRSVAEFWIDMKGRLILIRYFAVRGKAGDYMGCLEVTQDITDIQKIKGEKRLLD